MTGQVGGEHEAIAVAVVVSWRGLLAGERRDGVPPWTLPGGKIERGETPAAAAVREVAEECGLQVEAASELGSRVHPLTQRLMIYVACSPLDDAPPRAVSVCELMRVHWLDFEEVGDRMPDLYEAVRDYVTSYAAGELGSVVRPDQP